MVSIGKRAAAVGAAAALIAVAVPVGSAGAATVPSSAPVLFAAPAAGPPGPVVAAFQAGLTAAVGGLNAGADAAVGGWNAGATALGAPVQFTVTTWGPLGLHIPGVAPLAPGQ
jgi:hypothetical protein